MYPRLRRLLRRRGATTAPPPPGLDPRAPTAMASTSRRPTPDVLGRDLVPVLVIETPRSTTPPTSAPSRVSWFGGPATLVELDDSSPDAVVAAVTAWQHA